MKPTGYSTVSPYLVCEGAQAVVDFAVAVFDATLLRRYDNDDGSIMHAEFKIDDTVIMIGEASEDWPAFSSLLHVYVEDVDETFRKALKAGATEIEEPTEREGDPDRRGSVEDSAGNVWALASQVEG